MKKYLITGAGGFVASYFMEYLQDNHIPAEILGVDIAPQIECHFPNFTYVQADLTNKETIMRILADFRPDYVVHLASISSVSQSWQMPVQSFVNNTNIFLNLVESIRELELPSRVLSVGSSEEYGNYKPEEMPLKESYRLYPGNPYSVARVSQELLSKLYADSFKVDIVMTRSFNHIGPRQRDVFVVSSFVKQLVAMSNGGEQIIRVGNIDVIRDFLDVRDVVSAYYKILMYGKRGEIYNVCSGKGIRLAEIISKVSSLLNINPIVEIDPERFRPADNMVIIGDNSKIRDELSWSQHYSIEQTLQDLIDFWKEKQI